MGNTFWGYKSLVCFSLVFGLILFSCSSKSDLESYYHQSNIEKEGVSLMIDEKDFQEIKSFREVALKRGHISNKEKRYFKARISIDGKEYNVKARLKGDHTDHLSGERWSFRIKSQDTLLFGHNKFSIHAIHTRHYLNEWIFHKMLKKVGLLYLDYTYLPFNVNDTLKGYYAFESHFTAKVLQNGGREDGPILGFDESDYFGVTYYMGNPDREMLLTQCAKIKQYNKSYLKASDKNRAICDLAELKIDSLRMGWVEPHKVLDVNLWSKYFALSDFMGYFHNLHWHNLKFYFNPKTKLLEPIGCDLDASFDLAESWSLKPKKEYLHKLIFSSGPIRKEVERQVCYFSKEEFWEDFYDEIEDQALYYTQIIQKETPAYKWEPEAFWYCGYRLRNSIEKYQLECD